jgi:hypothetical protein
MRNCILIVAGVFASLSSSPTWAGWGCAYDSNVGVGRRSDYSTEEEARKATLTACTSRKFKNCRIIGCRANVDNNEQSMAIWPNTPGIKMIRCGEKGLPDCK